MTNDNKIPDNVLDDLFEPGQFSRWCKAAGLEPDDDVKDFSDELFQDSGGPYTTRPLPPPPPLPVPDFFHHEDVQKIFANTLRRRLHSAENSLGREGVLRIVAEYYDVTIDDNPKIIDAEFDSFEAYKSQVNIGSRIHSYDEDVRPLDCLPCECGVDAVGGGDHSTYCPKH